MAVASFTVSEMANKITLKIIDDLVEKAKEHSWPTARMGTTAPLIARDSAWAHALQQAQREAEFQHMASQSARMMNNYPLTSLSQGQAGSAQPHPMSQTPMISPSVPTRKTGLFPYGSGTGSDISSLQRSIQNENAAAYERFTNGHWDGDDTVSGRLWEDLNRDRIQSWHGYASSTGKPRFGWERLRRIFTSEGP